jgi:hypothetical protein
MLSDNLLVGIYIMPPKNYGRKGCIVKNCKETKHFSKGFCRYHYNQFFKGWRDEKGNKTDAYKGLVNQELKYTAKGGYCCLIKICKRRPEKKGFCCKHYKWLRKGQCDEKGTILAGPKIQRYNFEDKCKVIGCDVKPRKSGFCNKHYCAYRRGIYREDGGNSEAHKVTKRTYNKDFECIACGIKHVKFSLGFCKKHYNQYRAGLIDFFGKQILKRSEMKISLDDYPDDDELDDFDMGDYGDDWEKSV